VQVRRRPTLRRNDLANNGQRSRCRGQIAQAAA